MPAKVVNLCPIIIAEPMKAIKTKLKKATATPKGRIILFSIFIFFAAIIGSGTWYWNTHKKAFLKNKMETAVREKSKGLYRIEYGSLDMNEIAGSLTVANTNLIYDSIRYNELAKLGMAPSVLINISIPEINVTGVQVARILLHNEIVGRKLEIINPVINIIYTNPGKDSLHEELPKKIFEQILGNLNLIQADTILISGAQITTSSRRLKQTTISIQDVTMKLVDVKVDSAGNADTTRMLFAKEISIFCGKFAWTSPNKFYHFIVDSISINSASGDFHVRSFRVAPVLDEDAFVAALPSQYYRYDLSFNDIRMKNMNMPELFNENVFADSMLIGTASIKIYCDVAVHNNKKPIETYPLHVINVIPVPIRVGKLVLPNAFVEYKERSIITRQTGKVQFYNTYTVISNITNEKNAIAVNNVMTAEMSSMFLDKTAVKLKWHFYLLHPNGRFDVNGTFGAVNGVTFNPITVPLGLTRINSGYINKVEFNLQGNDQGMDGHVTMLYDDLNITMLEKEKGVKELDKKAAQSILANLVILNSNPRKKKSIRTVQVRCDRGINNSIFFLSWKSLFKGMRETVMLHL